MDGCNAHASEQFTYRRSGSCGCELLDAAGRVFAWTASIAWAAVITELLNRAADGMADICGDGIADTAVQTPAAMFPCGPSRGTAGPEDLRAMGTDCTDGERGCGGLPRIILRQRGTLRRTLSLIIHLNDTLIEVYYTT